MQRSIESMDYHQRRIIAHENVVDRWREERPADVDRLMEIYEGHIEDPLYEPVECQHDLEERFYRDVTVEMRNVPRQVRLLATTPPTSDHQESDGTHS